MRFKPITCAIAALSIGVSGLAFAQQDKDVRADQANRAEQARGGDRRGDQPGRGGPSSRAEPSRGGPDRGGPPPRVGYGDGRGAGPDHNFYRGGRLPPQWRSRQYVVDDWRGHHLSAPPRGYHWVQTGGDYVLVAVATGIIASILLNQ